MKVVLDTNVLLSAIGWAGPPRQILMAFREGEFHLVISPDLLDELTKALSYSRLQPVATHPSFALILEWLHRPEHIVIPEERIHAVPPDPSDDLVLEAAIAGRADAIISGDRHLLDLGSFRGIPILTARAFVSKYL